jgi:hypothetical protein
MARPHGAPAWRARMARPHGAPAWRARMARPHGAILQLKLEEI